MRLQITHLKAPWPLGAVVGDVLELPEVPAWALGKCEPVGDDVELTIVPLPVLDDEAKIAAALAEAEKQHAEELEAVAKAEADKKAAAEAKAEAVAKAEALGIDVDKRWSTARILEEIAKK